MAISFDTKAKIAASTDNPVTGSYTCGANARLLVLTLIYANGERSGTPTYNSIALTQADTVRFHTASPEARAELWFLLNPPTGSVYTISVPNPNGLLLEAVISSYIPAAGYRIVPNASAGGNGLSTNPSVSITVTAPSMIVAVVANGHDTWAPTGRTGTQLYDTDNGTWGGGHQYFWRSSNGSQAMSWTHASDDWGMVVAAFQEIPVGESVAKALVYGALRTPTGIAAGKAIVYGALRTPTGIAVAKANIYAVLAPPTVQQASFFPIMMRYLAGYVWTKAKK